MKDFLKRLLKIKPKPDKIKVIRENDRVILESKTSQMQMIKGKQFDKIAELASRIDPTDIVKPASKFMQGMDGMTEPKEPAPVASDLLAKGETTPEPEKPVVND